MEKTAKIIKVAFKKEWTGGKEPVYYHELELDNNDKGEIGCKEKLPAQLAVGCSLTYTIDGGQYGNKIKAVREKNGFGTGGFKKGPDPKVQVAGFAMAYTKDLVVAGKVEIKDLPAIFEKIHALMHAKI
jgi:hypothetical protein